MSCLVVNSHSSSVECLQLFFESIETYIGERFFDNIYLFINLCDYKPPPYVSTILYDQHDSFKNQMVRCLSAIPDEILLYCNEDYLLYDYAKRDVLQRLEKKLLDTDFSFIKLVYSDTEPYQLYEDKLYLIDRTCRNNYSQTMSLWKTADLLEIHQKCPGGEIGTKGMKYGHLEDIAKETCRHLNIKGLCYYNGEPKRGKYHFDSSIIPHMASAVIKGQWNFKEYPELKEILHASSTRL